MVHYTENPYDDYYYKYCCVFPNYDITEEEKLLLASQIRDDLGYDASYFSNNLAYAPFVDAYALYNAKYGDINDDTNVTPVDVSLLLNYHTEAQSDIDHESDSAIEFIGDMNNDGEITPIDAALILEQYAYEQTSID